MPTLVPRSPVPTSITFLGGAAPRSDAGAAGASCFLSPETGSDNFGSLGAHLGAWVGPERGSCAAPARLPLQVLEIDC